MRRPRRDDLKALGGRHADWAGPLLIVAVCFFCFGILLSRLGFFQDDWHHVFIASWQGVEGLKMFLLVDRGPFAWLVYAGLFKILGYSPAVWHWSLMLVRCLTALVFWLSCRRIWPNAAGAAAWLGLLFSVYPIFTLQPLAVAYALHWIAYLIMMLSMLAMIEAARRPRTDLLLTALAMALQVAHLALIEYFAGLEIARPVFLWLVLQNLKGRERTKRALILASPYLVILALYVIYRSSFAALLGYDRFEVIATLTGFLQSPLIQLLDVAQRAAQDVIHVLLSSWASILDPSLVDLARPSTYLVVGAAIVFAALAYLLLAKTIRTPVNEPEGFRGGRVVIGGLLVVVLSMLPFWFAGFSVFEKNQLWSARLALAAMPGAAMVIVGAVFALVEGPRNRHLVSSALLGLAVISHVQTGRSFQASWDKQRELYWQLHWRAPTLAYNTLLVADQEILFYMGIYPTAFAINVLYPQLTQPPDASYWFNAGFEHLDFERFATGKPATFEKYGIRFAASVDRVLATTFEPGLGQCLRVLHPELAELRGLPPAARTWLEVSNPSQIGQGPGQIPRADIFGHEPSRPWCYYFERADLAVQFHQWNEAVRLWDEAGRLGIRSSSGVELLPFVEAYANLGDWDRAELLTRQAATLPDRPIALLCAAWKGLGAASTGSPEGTRAVEQVVADLGCAE